MLRQAIASNDPVVYFEPKRLYHTKGEVDLDVDLADAPPMGLARVAREGTDVTLLTYGAQVATAMDAATAAEDDGISIEVIDLRSISPVDYRTVDGIRPQDRARRRHARGRARGRRRRRADRERHRACFNYLEAAPVRVTGPRHPVPAGEAREAPPARPRPDPRRRRPRARSAEPSLTREWSGRSCTCRSEDFRLPDLGEGLPEAELVQWLVAEGDTVTLNQTIAEVETAKAVVELPSPYAGVVTTLHAAAGDVVEVGSVLISFDVAGSGCRARPQPRQPSPTRRAAAAAAERRGEGASPTSSATAPRPRGAGRPAAPRTLAARGRPARPTPRCSRPRRTTCIHAPDVVERRSSARGPRRPCASSRRSSASTSPSSRRPARPG